MDRGYLRVKKASFGPKPDWNGILACVSPHMTGVCASELKYMLAGGLNCDNQEIDKIQLLQSIIGLSLFLTGLCFTFMGAYIIFLA